MDPVLGAGSSESNLRDDGLLRHSYQEVNVVPAAIKY